MPPPVLSQYLRMPQPSLMTLLGFLGKHGGLAGLITLTDLLNSRKKFREIATTFDMDAGQFSHLIRKLFMRRFVLHPELQEILDKIEQMKRENYEQQRRDSARILKFTTTGKKTQEEVG